MRIKIPVTTSRAGIVSGLWLIVCFFLSCVAPTPTIGNELANGGAIPVAAARGGSQTSKEQACIVEAAWRMQVPLEILFTLRSVEGGRPGLAQRNSNGTRDLGLFQVNTHWLDYFAEIYGRPTTEIEESLIWDTCFNAAIAAWILRYKIREAGDDFWKGVGNYHSATPRHHNRYLAAVMARLNRKLATQD